MGDFDAFLNWERTSRDTIDVKKIYIDMVDDLIAGVMLSQIVYWYLPSHEGNTKIRIIKGGKEWIAKSRHEWWDECRISPKQVDRALRLLVKAGIIETKLYKFNNTPTKHIRIIKEQFLTLWQNLISTKRENPFFPKGQNPISPKGEIQDLPQKAKSLTENTETTSDTTDIEKDSTPNGAGTSERRQKTDLIKAWWDALPELNRPGVDPKKMYAFKGYLSAAERALEKGVTPEKMTYYIKGVTYQGQFYHDKTVSFGAACANAPVWLASHYRPPTKRLTPEEMDEALYQTTPAFEEMPQFVQDAVNGWLEDMKKAG